MKLAIFGQEEPIFLGPFLQGVITLHPEHVVAVFLAGTRSAGEKTRTWRDRWQSLLALWLIFEPRDFLRACLLRLRAACLGRHDPRSIERCARRQRIPVYRVGDPNQPEFHRLLREIAPDIVLNQSEKLLRQEVLAIPRLGFVNRHASLLPRCRGRLGAFWGHAAEPPTYGLTIHQVDEGIDTGGIILQRQFKNLDPALPYPAIMRQIMADAPECFWQAMDKLATPAFQPTANHPIDPPHRFPTLDEAKAYRRTLAKRRRQQP